MIQKYLLLLLLPLLMLETAQALDMGVNISRYQSSAKPYIEVYFHVIASTVQASTGVPGAKSIAVNILFYHDGNLGRFEKLQINNNPAQPMKDFISMRRYGMNPGLYKIVFEAVDIADANNTFRDSAVLKISAVDKMPKLSDVQIFAKAVPSEDPQLSKHGYLFELIPYGFVSPKQDTIGILFESYHTDHWKLPVVNYLLRIDKMDELNKKTILRNWWQRKPTDMDVISSRINASQFESGRYRLMIALADSAHRLVDSVFYFFIKSNPEYDAAKLGKISADEIASSFAGKLTDAEVDYALQAILMNIPYKDIQVVNLILENKNIEAGRRYLYQHFKSLEPLHPEAYYTQYLEVARAADREFKVSGRYGFQSDRGLIFMKYGKPNDKVSIIDDPVAPPYEIWVYYQVPKLNQNNVKFLFYNPSLEGADYRLLTSNARGEIRNTNWKKELYKNAYREQPANTAPDRWDIGDGINRHAQELMEDL